MNSCQTCGYAYNDFEEHAQHSLIHWLFIANDSWEYRESKDRIETYFENWDYNTNCYICNNFVGSSFDELYLHEKQCSGCQYVINENVIHIFRSLYNGSKIDDIIVDISAKNDDNDDDDDGDEANSHDKNENESDGRFAGKCVKCEECNKHPSHEFTLFHKIMEVKFNPQYAEHYLSKKWKPNNTCVKCKKKFTNFKDMILHECQCFGYDYEKVANRPKIIRKMWEEHFKNDELKCGHCDQNFGDKFKLKQHINGNISSGTPGCKTRKIFNNTKKSHFWFSTGSKFSNLFIFNIMVVCF